MTVSSDLNRISYTGNGTTTVFPVNYYFLEDLHLLVVLRSATGVETVQTLTTNYTVTGAGNEAGGSVTMLVAPPVGTTLVIERSVPATQETDYLANDPFPAESHERALDKLTMLVQQNESANNRSIKIPITETSNTQVPNSVTRANKVLGFSAGGDVAITNSTITQIDAAVASFVNATGNNAASILYDPDGVSAVQATVQAKLRETVSVKDFGAVGDGVTDDTSAFISAIASVTASGARLYIPEGTYIITSTLTISGFVNINGDGILNTVIKASGNFSAVFTFSPTAYYSYVSNLSINTDSTTTQCVTIQLPAVVTRFYNIEFRGDKSGDLIYSNGDNTEFESCTWFLGTRDTIAVNLDSHNQNTGFLNCRFGGFGTGIVISNNFSPANRVEGARIDNCYFINTGPYNILLGNSLLTAINNCVLDQATTASLFLETGATNVLVNNSWLGLRFLLDGTPAITQSASVATVTMTQPHYLITGQFISVSGATQPEYNIQEFITVTGPNTFTYPITGSPASPATGAIEIRRPGQSFFAAAGCYGITLANNVIHGGTNGAVFGDSALARTSKVIIANNQFNAAYSASLGLGSLEDCVVTGNVDLSTLPNISWYTVGLHPSYGNYLFDNNHWLTSFPALFDANSTYRFGNDTGIVGRNRGNNTAVGSVTSLVISHGLFTTPSFVSVIANISLTNIYVDTITSTTFTVNWTGAATPTIYWSAEV
jgi:hypothetical protein